MRPQDNINPRAYLTTHEAGVLIDALLEGSDAYADDPELASGEVYINLDGDFSIKQLEQIIAIMRRVNLLGGATITEQRSKP